MVQDKYYGLRELSEFCEHVISSLFPISPYGAGTEEEVVAAASLGATSSPISLSRFIAYALYRTRLPLFVTHHALLLLSRLKSRYPAAQGSSTSPHRLFLASLMLASKIDCDDSYSNKSWQIVSQNLFTLQEVNQMERELFKFLGYSVGVRAEDLAAWIKEVTTAFELERTLQGTPDSPRPLCEDRKRRRETSRSSSPSSYSSSPSPPSPASSADAEARHSLASDAAAAILGVEVPPLKKRSSERSSRRQSSPFSDGFSSSASTFVSSPMSEPTTPGSLSPPSSEGPLTPETEVVFLKPAWDNGTVTSCSMEGYDGFMEHGTSWCVA